MASQKELKDYLVGKSGYLKNSDNNSKVIMLSGKWGSGKTHFWQEEIIPRLNEEDNKIPNHYISLYGKTSIDEIKNEVFLKVFESVDSFELKEKTNKFLKNTTKLVSSVSKTITVFGVNVDLTKVSDKPFDKIEEILQSKKLKKTAEYLNSGAIICFDDFERKSKEIDLNDLFGFITQLSLNFKCKIVIILNDDVFEGKEKNIFSNVKEKTISKYLYYNPTFEQLFDSIFFNDEKYRKLDNYRDIILRTIEETEELNARIYIQVLDNLLEWIEKVDDDETEVEVLQCLILVNINFIIYHTIAEKKDRYYIVKGFYNLGFDYNSNRLVGMAGYKEFNSFDEYINHVIGKLVNREKSQPEFRKKYQEFIEENITMFKSEFFINKWNISEGIKLDIFNKINNFIETGILIKESN